MSKINILAMVAGNSIYLRTDGLSEGEDLTFCKTDEIGFMFLNENMKKILEDVLQMVENWWNYLIFDIFQTACCVVVRKIKNIEESYRKTKKLLIPFCAFFFSTIGIIRGICSKSIEFYDIGRSHYYR